MRREVRDSGIMGGKAQEDDEEVEVMFPSGGLDWKCYMIQWISGLSAVSYAQDAAENTKLHHGHTVRDTQYIQCSTTWCWTLSRK